MGLGARFALLSKETTLLANNVLFLVAAGAVLLGTLYPLFLDALGMGKISVGPPYFDTIFLPLMVPVVFLMGIGPVAKWKQAALPDITVRLRWAALAAVLAAFLTGFAAGELHVGATCGLVMAYWILASIAEDVWTRVGARSSTLREAGSRMRQLPRAWVGMMVAHAGVAAFCFGVAMVRNYEVEKDVQMEIGDSTSLKGYTFTFKGTRELQGPNYSALQGVVEVVGGGTIREMHPEKRVYRVQQNPMTEAAIDAGVSRDLYVSLGEQLDSGAWIIRVYVKPFINWIWFGCLLMAAGGLVAASDRRYRKARKDERQDGDAA